MDEGVLDQFAATFFQRCMETRELPNPSVPLPFEKYSNKGCKVYRCTNEDNQLTMDIDKMEKAFSSVFLLEHSRIKLDYEKADSQTQKPSKEIHEAQLSALFSFGRKSTVSAADKLLEQHNIPEPYNMKAMFQSKDYHEALKWYTKAADVAIARKKEFEKVTTGPNLFKNYYERSYARALCGQANCQRKLGRYAEAEEKFRELQKLDPEPTWMSPAYADWQFYILEVLMKQGKYKEADALAKSEKFRLSCVENIYRNTMVWTHALLDYKCHNKRSFDFDLCMLTEDDYLETTQIYQYPLGVALWLAPHVLDFLSGKVKLPNRTVPPKIGQRKAWTLAAEYARAYLPLWQETPGAIEWVEKNANTFHVMMMIGDMKDYLFEDAPMLTGDKIFRKYVQAGVFLNDSFPRQWPDKQPLLHQTLLTSYKRAEILLEAGAKVTSDNPDFFDPLVFASFHDANPRCVPILIKYGSNPYAKRLKPDKDDDKTWQTAVEAAASCGNARYLHAIFSVRPPDTKACDEVLMALVRTDGGVCLSGIAKCSVCRGGGPPHPDNASIEHSILALLVTGYRPSERIMGQIISTDCTSGDICKSCPYEKLFYKTLKKLMKLDRKTLLQKLETRYGRILPYCAVCRSYYNLQKCSRCKLAYYCGSKCQKEDWENHRLSCSKKLR